MKLYKELRLQDNRCLYTFIESEVRNDKVHKVEKVTKINSRIISKPRAHLQTMAKTCAKFHKDRYKIVCRVALTRYPLSLDCMRSCAHKVPTVYTLRSKNDLSSQSGKRDKKKSINYIQTTCTSSHHEENICKVSKRSVKNCKRSCAHKTPMVNVDGRTDRWTDRQSDG